ncbi:MAG TPA: hypothetical protein VEB59_13180 [Gemmatimonadales bacterium]|nr:hypothetical protein [Gemmatimonadales bacterium]
MPLPRRRRLVLVLLSLPAAATATLWLASHCWYIWYCSLPSGTLVRGISPTPKSTKVRVFAGAVHCTDDATYERSVFKRPPASGSVSLGTSYDPKDGTALSGITIRWFPRGFTATRWKPHLYPGNWGFPLYIPLALFLLAPLTYWALSRPLKAHHCAKCRYNRAGLPLAARCPECGSPP